MDYKEKLLELVALVEYGSHIERKALIEEVKKECGEINKKGSLADKVATKESKKTKVKAKKNG